MKKIISINNNLKTLYGHFFSHDLEINNGCDRLNIEFSSLSNKNFETDNQKFIKTFSSTETGTSSRDSIDTFTSELCESIKVENENKTKIYFAYIGSSQEYTHLLTRILPSLDDKSRIYINLFDLHFYYSNKKINNNHIKYFVKNYVKKFDNTKVKFFTDSYKIQELFYNEFKHKLEIFPLFFISQNIEINKINKENKNNSSEFNVYYPGKLTESKGAKLLNELSQSLTKNKNVLINTNNKIIKINFKCSVNTNATSSNINKIINNLNINKHNLSLSSNAEEYFKNILDSDLVLLPYDRTYKTRTSGIIVDCGMLNRPVLALKNSWIGDVIEKSGAGFTFEHGTAEEILELILLSVNKFNMISKNSKNILKNIKEYSTVEIFIKDLFNYRPIVPKNKVKVKLKLIEENFLLLYILNKNFYPKLNENKYYDTNFEERLYSLKSLRMQNLFIRFNIVYARYKKKIKRYVK